MVRALCCCPPNQCRMGFYPLLLPCKVVEDVSPGDLIAEYVGEIIDEEVRIVVANFSDSWSNAAKFTRIKNNGEIV